MESFAKLLRLHVTLRNRRTPIAATELQRTLDCSRATMHRSLDRLKALGAPIINSPGRGYLYDRNQEEFELPGFWLNAEELSALLAMDALRLGEMVGVVENETFSAANSCGLIEAVRQRRWRNAVS